MASTGEEENKVAQAATKTGDRGIITLFSLSTCPHCRHVKSSFAERGWEYNNIDIGLYPEKRKDMLALADRLTVPQIFFNNFHVGGASDLDEKSPEELETLYSTHIVNGGGVELDPRLSVPDYKPKPEEKPSQLTLEEIHIGNWSGDFVQVSAKLAEELDIADRKYHLVNYEQCFLGTNLVDTILRIGGDGLSSRQDALEVAKGLVGMNILHHVTYEHNIRDEELFYRLQIHEPVTTLNTLISWTDRVDSNPMVTIKHLKSLITAVVEKHTDSADELVDYAAIKVDPDFIAFDRATCELQKVDLRGMDIPTRTAFVINLYNMMIPHAFAKFGTPQTSYQRGVFFDNVAYNLGGLVFSFSDLENGVLRGNKVPPYHLRVPFKKGSDRAQAANPNTEPRIHFALNCGAKSCPPVKTFSVDSLDEELRVVSLAFFEQDTNFAVDKDQHLVKLSSICKWYSSDFGSNSQEVIRTISQWLRAENAKIVNEMLESGTPIKVKYFTYDWSNNAKPVTSTPATTCSVS